MAEDGPEFTCGHCGAYVPATGSRDVPAHNACPECEWSKHVSFGVQVDCGAMMKPVFLGDGNVIHRCTGCAFMMRMPTETRQMEFIVGGRAGPRDPIQMWGAGGSSWSTERGEFVPVWADELDAADQPKTRRSMLISI